MKTICAATARAASSTRTVPSTFTAASSSGFATELPLGAMAQNNVRVRRIYVGSVSMFEAMNRAIEVSAIRPVIDKVYAFGHAPEAYRHMASGAHFGKIVVSVD